MKVLMMSTDRRLFEENSSVRGRILNYGSLVDELHILVFTTKKHGIKEGKVSLGDNVYLYPTVSLNRWFYVFSALRIGKTILGKDGWVITTQDPFETGWVGKKLSKRFDVPLQLQVHTDFLSPHFKKQSYLNRLRLLISKSIIRQASAIRVVSERIARALVSSDYKSRAKLHVLPIFVNIKQIKKTTSGLDLHEEYPMFKDIILVSSRLEPEKNVELSIKVFKKVMEKYPETGLVIIGDGSERANLEFLGVRNVVFEGWQNDVASYHKTADIFLNTSNYEGYGMTLVEAAAGETPVVTTDVGIANDLLINEESALVCDVGDEDCLAQSIIRLIEDQGLKERLVSGASLSLEKNLKSKREYLKSVVATWKKLS